MNGNAALTDQQLDDVNRLIDAFLRGDNPDPVPERSAHEIEAIQASNVLPTLEDWSAFGAITREGRLVWVEREPPYSQRLMTEPRHRRFALFEASVRFPTLHSLCPVRPDEARTCDQCEGTGKFSAGIDQSVIRVGHRNLIRTLDERVVCVCGGLGWLLESD